MDLFRLSGDRFTEYWPLGDNLTLMPQLRSSSSAASLFAFGRADVIGEPVVQLA